MVRNIFHWVWFLISMFFPQEEPNPQGILGEVFLLWWLPRGTEPPPPQEVWGVFLLSWPLRGSEILQGNLGGFFLLHGL
jgi:hypothetical protein